MEEAQHSVALEVSLEHFQRSGKDEDTLCSNIWFVDGFRVVDILPGGCISSMATLSWKQWIQRVTSSFIAILNHNFLYYKTHQNLQRCIVRLQQDQCRHAIAVRAIEAVFVLSRYQ